MLGKGTAKVHVYDFDWRVSEANKTLSGVTNGSRRYIRECDSTLYLG